MKQAAVVIAIARIPASLNHQLAVLLRRLA